MNLQPHDATPEGKDQSIYVSVLMKRRTKVDEIEVLLRAGADPNARDEDQRTPLHFAARRVNQNPAVVEALIKAGADPTARDEDKETPLHLAVWYGETLENIEALLRGGADPNARNKDKSTPLHIAARHNGNPEVIEALLKAGADPKAQDEAKQTPVHHAARYHWDLQVIKALLNAGAAATSDGPSGDVGTPASGGPCELPNYPSPPDSVSNLGLLWCPPSVDLQVRSVALQAAGEQCSIAKGDSSTPEQIQAKQREIREACDRLAVLGEENCQCPSGLWP